MDILNLYNIGFEILKKNKIKNTRLECEILLSHILEIERYKIYTEKIEVPEIIKRRFLTFIKKRIKGVPLQYITKEVYFFENKFKIEKGVFIPRPETELLVEKTIKIYRENFYPEYIKILDIGTGCGNIAISLAKNIENSYIIGVDISKKSLKISKENARLNKVDKKTNFKYSNLFSNINEKFDIIISNPPYIKKIEYDNLSIEIKNEPKRALIAGEDGLKIIKMIIKESPFFLKKEGFLILEIGYNQFEDLKKIIPYKLNLISIEKDFNGYDRILVFKRRN
ncbi:MAG: peptide chain release factor N(5)-glutamine methyltransferase [Candidatus Omnitrophica bacterium]|nr:peptide chain release factor N(5)-glutamine methyltransferase [Candidatus Omnitrophota bacterium]